MEPAVSFVEVNGAPCRVWRKGAGPAVGYLAGHGGLPKWIPFLDVLAERFTVIAPSLPGYQKKKKKKKKKKLQRISEYIMFPKCSIRH